MPLDSTNLPTTEVDETTALLVRARGLLERGWCRGVTAIDATGEHVYPASDRAAAWCAIGALEAVGGNYYLAIDRLRAAIGGGDICVFNNTQETVEPVLAH